MFRPLIFAGLIPMEKVPSSPAVPLPSVFPRLSLITTVLPASVVPVSLSPASLTASLPAPAAACRYQMVKETDCPLVPCSFVAVAVKTWSPSASASEGGKAPFAISIRDDGRKNRYRKTVVTNQYCTTRFGSTLKGRAVIICRIAIFQQASDVACIIHYGKDNWLDRIS
ncbi:Uncharacterised protein [Salmonella bongori]|nr:Uncharacterised protein [Salmonella bongori]